MTVTTPAPVSPEGTSHEIAVETVSVDVRFGEAHVVRDASVTFAAGVTSGLVGPNGAGKTTLLNCISGLVPAAAGDVFLYGQRSTGIRPHKLAPMGISRSYQGAQLVGELTAIDNVLIGDHRAQKVSMLSAGLLLPRAGKEERAARARAMDALERVGLADHAAKTTKELPYGMQKRIDLARALVSAPRCILLDEPMAGLSRGEKQDVVKLLSDLRDRGGPTLIIVEHDMRVINQLCSEVVVLAAGAVLAVGTPEHVLNLPEVVEAYIGGGEDKRPQDDARSMSKEVEE